jgi:glyoxylase-like metal-dependent hydrolase (beta-lactamase superfamily II)
VAWDEVGDGCFRRRYRTFYLNIGVVRGSDALLIVDTRADLRQADELLDELRWFGRPVRWVVNSHWHFDHVFGNQRFVERARGRSPAPRPSTSRPMSSCGGTSIFRRCCSTTNPN